jgi:DNA primase
VARYTDDSKDRVREAANLVELVAARTGEPRRTGPSGYMGLCPFHDESTPSFSIEPHKKLFHCFGCGESGDVFDFVQRTEGVDFTGAIELLADRYGVRLEREAEDPAEAQRRERRERLLELLERTATFYVRFLWESREAAKAREYLAERGLEEATLREFRVGYAPSAWDATLKASMGAGFKARELYDAGLVQRAKGEGRIYDRFRGRIMFPLADTRGRVLGFGARAMRDGQGAKYINTAENELFHKGRLLYAADLARAHATRAGSAILCEGYTDVIALHQAGLRNAVAAMGTSLTSEQVGELAKLAPVVQLALDADAAGQTAMVRAAQVAKDRKLELRVVPLPAGRDPADVIAEEGGDAMRGLAERSVPFVRFRVERELAIGDLTSAEGKDRVIGELRPVFQTIPESLERRDLLRLVSDRLDVPEQVVAQLVGRARGGGGRVPAPPAGAPAQPGIAAAEDHRLRTERAFLTLCVRLPERGAEMLAQLDVEAHFTAPATRRAAEWLRGHLHDPLEGLGEDDGDLHGFVGDLVRRALQQPGDAASLEAEFRRLQRAQVRRLIEQRVRRGEAGVAELRREDVRLAREIDEWTDRALQEKASVGGAT